MNGSSPIKIDLTFKLYKDKSLAGSGYQEAILFLTHICAPPKRVKLGTDSVDLIKRVGDGVYNIATEVMNSGKAMMNSDMSTFGNGAATLVNTANDLYNKATSQAILGRNNGNFTVLLCSKYIVVFSNGSPPLTSNVIEYFPFCTSIISIKS